MKVLLSIKPEYVERILSREKRFEFRRKIFKRPDIDTLVIYASSPIQRVVAEAPIRRILSARPEQIWKATHKHGGISKDKFFEYFHGTDTAYAIEIDSVYEFDEPVLLHEFEPRLTCAPQSFAYIH